MALHKVLRWGGEVEGGREGMSGGEKAAAAAEMTVVVMVVVVVVMVRTTWILRRGKWELYA